MACQVKLTHYQDIVTFQVPPNHLLGAVVEFNTLCGSATNFQLRTSASTTSTRQGNIGDRPAVDDGHVRGLWTLSGLELFAGNFDAKPVAGTHQKVIQCCAALGPEELQFPKSEPWGTANGNRGLYGVNLAYKFILTNVGGSQPYPVYAYLQARNNGVNSEYAGALQILDPFQGPAMGIPRLAVTLPPGGHFIRLLETDTGETPIMVNPNEEVELFITLTNAGACATPFNLALSGLAFTGVIGDQ